MTKFASNGQVSLYNPDGSAVSFPILEGYAASDIDEADVTHNYYGFLKTDGSYYIMQITKDGTTIRYFAGSSGYSTLVTGAWAIRTTLSYDYFNAIF